MAKLNMKGQGRGRGLTLFLIIIMVVAIFLVLPGFSGILSGGPGAFIGNASQGVVISGTNIPSSVAPFSKFQAVFSVSDNLNGITGSNIKFCLDNLGLFNLTSGSQCIAIPSILAGATLPETFFLQAPPNGAYGNIPYVQEIGYYLTYSYSSSASQSIEFVSQSAYSQGSYPPPTASSFGASAGPVALYSSVQQPVVYSDQGQLSINLNNGEPGIILGNVTLNIYMNNSIMSIPSPSSFGLTETISGSEAHYVISTSVGAGGFSLRVPIGLTTQESSTLTSGNIPSFTGQMKMNMSYQYEQNGYYPISLQTETYYIH